MEWASGSLFYLKRGYMNNAKNLLSEEREVIVTNAIKDCMASQFEDIEFVELDVYKEYGKLNLNVLIWKKEGIGLNDCESVHNSISAELDKYEDLFPAEYILNVSSQGLDRKIVSNDDYRRALETEIECVDKDKNKAHGKLISYDDEQVILEIGGKKPTQKTLNRKNLTKVQAYIRF